MIGCDNTDVSFMVPYDRSCSPINERDRLLLFLTSHSFTVLKLSCDKVRYL